MKSFTFGPDYIRQVAPLYQVSAFEQTYAELEALCFYPCVRRLLWEAHTAFPGMLHNRDLCETILSIVLGFRDNPGLTAVLYDKRFVVTKPADIKRELISLKNSAYTRYTRDEVTRDAYHYLSFALASAAGFRKPMTVDPLRQFDPLFETDREAAAIYRLVACIYKHLHENRGGLSFKNFPPAES